MDKHHFLLLSCPSQGHINPTLHLAKLLLRVGVRVTFATFVSGLRRIATLPTIPGLHFASFSDGYDDGNNSNYSMEEMKRVGSQSLSSLLLSLSNERGPVTYLIYGFLLSWAATVAREHGIPSAFLSTQSATVIAVYHRYFKAHDGLFNTELGNSLNISLELPGLPPLKYEDLPSILLPTSRHASFVPSLQEHIQNLEQDPNPCVLINTFNALEEDVIKALGDFMNVVAIGPLVQLDSSISCDLFERSKDYLPWLNSKPEGSVIYVSFGSLATLQKKQMEEIFHGLMEMVLPSGGVVSPSSWMFLDALWVELHHGESSCRCAGGGMSPVFGPGDKCKAGGGVGTGVKARANEEGVVEREEIKKCLEMVMEGGEKGDEMRRNANKWKGLAVESMEYGSSGETNLKHFVESLEIRTHSCKSHL
ncbi:UDP-glycosyltransferase 75C1 [Vitis vinifera]|uniref:UDP-glycosyltransferase 75C1 n=1 Tax=Vitis vinifera TaxID=29760 RepID=A0A438D6M0_VITVI|nr:UDP-glycosyltransferase 75C1 [Vitis vinifera]